MFGSNVPAVGMSFALVDNFAGASCEPGTPTLLPFDNINHMSPDFTLANEDKEVHFGPGVYIITVDAYVASVVLSTGSLTVQSVIIPGGLGATSVNQPGISPAALTASGPLGFGFVSTPFADNYVSLQVIQTDSVSRAISGDLLIIRLSKTHAP